MFKTNSNFHRKDTQFQRHFGQNRLRKPGESVKFVKNTGFIQEYLYICTYGAHPFVSIVVFS